MFRGGLLAEPFLTEIIAFLGGPTSSPSPFQKDYLE
jgi:hypothetical protein